MNMKTAATLWWPDFPLQPLDRVVQLFQRSVRKAGRMEQQHDRSAERGHDRKVRRVFLSTAYFDAAVANGLREALEREGVEVRQFKDVAQPGAHWSDTLSAELKRSDALIVLLSRKSVVRPGILLELSAALGYRAESTAFTVFSVFLDSDVEVSDVLDLRSTTQIDATDGNYERVTRAVLVKLGRQVGAAQARSERQGHIEQTSEIYIEQSIDDLRKRERGYRRLAWVTYLIALSTLAIGADYAVTSAATLTAAKATAADILDWPAVLRLTVANLVVIGLIGALARCTFVLGRSFMVEALRIGNRSHAISFGRFYLRAYGKDAQWAEIKEVFQYWNIDTGSSFMSQTAADADPQILQTVSAAVGSVLQKAQVGLPKS